MRYRYCPDCGRKLTENQAGDDGMVPYCEACGKYWFDTFSSAVIIMVINENNEIAMLKQDYLSEKYWTYVSGFMKPGETAEETAIREVKEEIGLDIDQLDYAGTYWFAKRDMLMIGFVGHAKKKDFILSGEVDAAKWVPAVEAEGMMFPEAPGNTQQPIYREYFHKVEFTDYQKKETR